ncbi:transglutaminase family protein [Parerythrobacter aestuarii]|uniref:transglutaminase family protein n=1 Tax=Parerythrobacter aestuarii TaxID=3020909 RepID=UPI0024DE36DE|nr:transglutaminase family protein [Parerythrobacter aestuarii]
MRLSVRHTTLYTYTEPAVHGLQRLRLTPKSTQGQKIIDWAMRYENARPELEYEDQHHNTVTLIAVEEEARHVTVECTGIVETEDNAGVIGRHSGHLPLWSFMGQTPLTAPGAKLRAFLRDVDHDTGEPLDYLHKLSAAIRDRVEYRVGETGVRTTAEQAIEQGSGVCQDHAHIFIAAARAAEFPARYVSGYLMMNDRVDQDATHAWAEAHVEGLGWVGFDISNGISPDRRYIRVATGRDYRDAAPVTGISLGGRAEGMQVQVAVEQQTIEQ